MATAASLGVIVSITTWQVWGHLAPEGASHQGDGNRIFPLILGTFVFLYVLTPFAQIFQRSGRPRFPYPELFDHSWNNFFVGLVAALFTGVFWALLGVWAGLFSLLEISFFKDVFTSKSFAYISSFTVFGYGLGLGRSSENVISTLRRITLMIAQALLPLVALIALLFAVALPFTGMGLLWATGRATPLVLSLLGFMVLFVNGVFEDGDKPAPYPGLIRLLVGLSVILMPLYAGIALYGTSLRVGQHGLTPQRVYALLFGVVAAVYSLGYATAALRRRAPWLGLIRPVNIGAALFVATLAILIQLYPLDPLRLSAENQASRLARGEVPAGEFDYATLRFRLGHYGWEKLAELESMLDHSDIAMIRDAIEFVRAAESFWTAQRGRPAGFETLEFVTAPGDLDVPISLLQAVNDDHNQRFGTKACRDDSKCLIIGTDLDADGRLEFCLLSEPNAFFNRCYAATSSDEYEVIGTPVFEGDGGRPSIAEIERRFRDGDKIPTQQSRFLDLVVPGGRLHVTPNRSLLVP